MCKHHLSLLSTGLLTWTITGNLSGLIFHLSGNFNNSAQWKKKWKSRGWNSQTIPTMHLSSVSLTQRPTLFHQNLSADYEMIKSMSRCVAGLIKTMWWPLNIPRLCVKSETKPALMKSQLLYFIAKSNTHKHTWKWQKFKKPPLEKGMNCNTYTITDCIGQSFTQWDGNRPQINQVDQSVSICRLCCAQAVKNSDITARTSSWWQCRNPDCGTVTHSSCQRE